LLLTLSHLPLRLNAVGANLLLAVRHLLLRLGAVGANLLLTLRHLLLRLGAVRANLLPLRHLLLRLRMVGADLFASSYALLRLGVIRTHLLTLGDAGLHARLALTLGSLDALWTLSLRVAAAPALVRLRPLAAPVVVIRPLGLLIALAAVVRTRTCRGCDRHRGNACGEKHPGHDSNSFRTAKTARSLHRSNVKRMEPAPYRSRVNLKLPVCSGS
jgi:hypothetical protein